MRGQISGLFMILVSTAAVSLLIASLVVPSAAAQAPSSFKGSFYNESVKGYLYAEFGGGKGGDVFADKSDLGPWQTFQITDLNGGELEDGDSIRIKAEKGYLFAVKANDWIFASADASDSRGVFKVVLVTERLQKPRADRRIRNRDVISLQTSGGTLVSVVGQKRHQAHSWAAKSEPGSEFLLIVH